jgi:hypothetical protein
MSALVAVASANVDTHRLPASQDNSWQASIGTIFQALVDSANDHNLARRCVMIGDKDTGIAIGLSATISVAMTGDRTIPQSARHIFHVVPIQVNSGSNSAQTQSGIEAELDARMDVSTMADPTYEVEELGTDAKDVAGCFFHPVFNNIYSPGWLGTMEVA